MNDWQVLLVFIVMTTYRNLVQSITILANSKSFFQNCYYFSKRIY